MALIVDDTPDVWHSDLQNLCLVRRFQGHAADDGLMQLSFQLQGMYNKFYHAGQAAGGWKLDDPLCPPPDLRALLADKRSTSLSGCRIAFTGVLPTNTDDMSEIALCVLVGLCGGEVTASLDSATHLVARQTTGWEKSSKIRQAAKRKVRCSAYVAKKNIRIPPRPSSASIATQSTPGVASVLEPDGAVYYIEANRAVAEVRWVFFYVAMRAGLVMCLTVARLCVSVCDCSGVFIPNARLRPRMLRRAAGSRALRTCAGALRLVLSSIVFLNLFLIAQCGIGIGSMLYCMSRAVTCTRLTCFSPHSDARNVVVHISSMRIMRARLRARGALQFLVA